MRHFWYLLLDCLHATAVICASGLSGGSKATSSGEQDTLCRIALTLGCLLCVHRLSHLLTVRSRCLPDSAEMSSDLRSLATCPEAGKLGDVAERALRVFVLRLDAFSTVLNFTIFPLLPDTVPDAAVFEGLCRRKRGKLSCHGN